MKLLIAFIAMFSVSAMAADYELKEVNFKVSDRAQNGSKVYFNCDSVESTVASSLKKLGAKEVKVNCRGGIDRHGSHHLPAYVSTSFEALNADINSSLNVSFQEVVFKNRNNCHLINSIIKNVNGEFEISELKMRRCLRSDSHARVSLSVLKEN